MFNSIGQLDYNSAGKLILLIDREIVNYYYSLIPKYYYPNRQFYPPHITVVRCRIEKPANLDFWGKYQGEELQFSYNSVIEYVEPYFYINCWSPKLCKIRQELGLLPFRQGFNSFHFSIANLKKEKYG